MILSSLRPESSVVDFLESQARRESIRDLVYRTVAALVVVMIGFAPVPVAKPILMTASFAYLSYGMWGLLDRARSHSISVGNDRTAQYLKILCAFFVVLGVLSGIGLLMAIGFTLLGSPWVL